VPSKNIWIGLTIVIIWLVVLMTSLGSTELTFGDEPVILRPAAILNWFWGLLGTVFVLRTTLFRRPNEMGWGETDAYPWITVVVGVSWIVALLATNMAPEIVVNDNITVPIGAIVAPPIAVAVTLYACDFLISGFASRRPLRSTANEPDESDSPR
jgi:hypothetical protein